MELLFATADPLGSFGPWFQGGAVSVLAGLVIWMITKTLPEMNRAADARTVAFLKAIDDQRNVGNLAFAALTRDYREEMKLEREAHARENAEFRDDLRALGDKIKWANGSGK